MSDPERERILNNARKLRAHIEQIFVDAASWNEHSTARKNGADAINPDPFGEMRRLADAIDKMLAEDPGHGPLAPIEFTRSH
jgi:hypothetical protein